MDEKNTPHKEVDDRVVSYFGANLALAKTLGYRDLRNLSARDHGLYPSPKKHCVTIARETNKAIDRRQLRPSDWQDIWPGLAATKA